MDHRKPQSEKQKQIWCESDSHLQQTHAYLEASWINELFWGRRGEVAWPCLSSFDTEQCWLCRNERPWGSFSQKQKGDPRGGYSGTGENRAKTAGAPGNMAARQEHVGGPQLTQRSTTWPHRISLVKAYQVRSARDRSCESTHTLTNMKHLVTCRDQPTWRHKCGLIICVVHMGGLKTGHLKYTNTYCHVNAPSPFTPPPPPPPPSPPPAQLS